MVCWALAVSRGLGGRSQGKDVQLQSLAGAAAQEVQVQSAGLGHAKNVASKNWGGSPADRKMAMRSTRQGARQAIDH